jgi:hypothetical protein
MRGVASAAAGRADYPLELQENGTMYRRTFLSATAVVMSLIGGTASADLYNFGAIAFDQDSGQWAYSYDWSSRQRQGADQARL